MRAARILRAVLFLSLLLTVGRQAMFCAADDGSLAGFIRDSQTGEPLLGANVVLVGTGFGAASDADGRYAIRNVPPGEYVVRSSYLGYHEKTVPVIVAPGAHLLLDVALAYRGAFETEVVVVTAQAKSQMNAINEQLSANAIKNVVASSRIQELPDANAAESVGRLPGVSLLRDGGEGTKVVIRGLAPKYTKVMIEGVSLPATGGDRSTDMSMISPFALDGIEVIKAVTADQDGDYMGGTVNVKLKEADPGFRSDIVLQGGFNGLKNTYADYFVSGSAADRLLADRLGIYVQGNLEQRNRSSNQLGATYELRNPELGIENDVFTQSLTVADAIRERSRFGATLVADYRLPEGSLKMKNLFNHGKTSTTWYNELFKIADRSHQYETRDVVKEVSVLTNVARYEQRWGVWTARANASHTYTENDVPTDLSFAFNQFGALDADVLSVSVAPHELVRYSTVNDALTYFTYLNEGYTNTRERQIELEADLTYEFSLSHQINGSVKAGGKYRRRNRSHDEEVYGGNFGLSSGQTTKDAILRAFPWMQQVSPIGSSLLPYVLFTDGDFRHGNVLAGEYTMGPGGDVRLLHEVLNVIKGVENPSLETYTRDDYKSNRSDYEGSELLTAAYVMTEISLGPTIKLIPGVRYERDVTEYAAAQGDASLPFPNLFYVHKDTTTSRVNEHVLPMIHLRYSPVEWFSARIAYTHTLSRPSYDVIVPRVDILRDMVVWNNYALEPEFAENLDVYLSFRQNTIGLFTVGGFTKRIENMIFGLDRRVILNPDDYHLSPKEANKDIYTQANSSHPARVWGIEMDWQTIFWYLPVPFNGLVLNVNYTRAFSGADYPRTVVNRELDLTTFTYTYSNVDTFYTERLQFQPDHILNASLGFDYEGFSGRVSLVYQSGIFQKADFWKELSSSSDEYMRFDLSVKQALPWYGLQIFLNVSNATGAMERTLNARSRFPATIQHYGSTAEIGLRVRF